MGKIGCCVFLASSLLTQAAESGARCVHWPSGSEINVYLNRRSFTDRGFNGTAVEHLTRAAIDEWSTAGRANLRLRYAGLRDYEVPSNDTQCSNTGQDVIIQMNPGLQGADCTSWLAGTECDPDTSPAPCCIRVWQRPECTSIWTEGWPAPGVNSTYSFWDTITHELGHVLCLPHADDFGDPPLGDPPQFSSDLVMYSLASTTTTQRFLKPHDIYRLLAPRTDPGTGENVEYGDRTDYEVVHRYDEQGDGMGGQIPGWSFPGDPQDGVALDIEGASWVAAWSDADDGSQLKFSESSDGVDWDAPINIGSAHSVQVPAIATQGSRHVVAYSSGYARGGDDPAWGGTGRSIYARTWDGYSWSGSVLVGTSYSGPALANYGGACFIIAYVTYNSSCPDCIRTKVSCDYGATWGSEYTDDVRSTDRPAIAWGSNGVWGGVLWTTNVKDDGTRWANHIRHGRLGNALGLFYLDPSPVEANLKYTSNFPGLTVSDSGAPQPNRYVRLYRSYAEGPAGAGRQILSGYLDDLTTNGWVNWCCSGDSRSPPSAAYSWGYDEFWSLFDQ